MDIRQTENGKVGWCHSIWCDFHSANQLARLGLDVTVQRVNELVLTIYLMIMIKENTKIHPVNWLDWKMWPRYFFEANNDRVLAAAFDFLKSDGTDRHLGNCTANLYMQFNLKVHLSYFFVIHILRSCSISSFLSSFVLSLLAKMTAIPTRKLCSYCLLLTLILMLPFYELKYRI